MNVKKKGTQVSNYVVQHLPRNPSIFSGEDGEDIQKWLKGYERVARYNHWDTILLFLQYRIVVYREAITVALKKAVDFPVIEMVSGLGMNPSLGVI
ncbi:hypothetical protein LAZ67_12002882 [Cordylochernes scorpioides]|uniref:Uncharacterized protein n=1 Tax=Cordylochernes scorpioides TaxID=51811 RepID=A0ABY6L236_9ARAC|nr:hypothetical protein LAZ67_12002882 [Cordylochernes scorpioides]